MEVRIFKSQFPCHMIKNFLGVDLVFFSFGDRGIVATAVDAHRLARVAFAFGIHWAVSFHLPFSREASRGSWDLKEFIFYKYFKELVNDTKKKSIINFSIFLREKKCSVLSLCGAGILRFHARDDHDDEQRQTGGKTIPTVQIFLAN